MNINQETKSNLIKSAVFLLLTAGMIFLIFRFGLLTAVKISEFLQKNNITNEEAPLDNYLASPSLLTVPEATNSGEQLIEGFGPVNKEIVIYLNEIEDQSVSVDSEGKFSTMLNLALGINKFYAIAKDFDGNLSNKSNLQIVYYSNIPPFIDILEPEPGSVVNNNPDIVIKGKTEISSKVFINEKLVLVDSEGNFSFNVKLVKGENKFKVVSTDPAHNTSEEEFSLQFRP